MGGFFSRRQEARQQLGRYNFSQQRGEKLLNASAEGPCTKYNNYCLHGGRKTLKKAKKAAKSAKKLKKTSKRRL